MPKVMQQNKFLKDEEISPLGEKGIVLNHYLIRKYEQTKRAFLNWFDSKYGKYDKK